MKNLVLLFAFLISTTVGFSQSLESSVISKINELRAKSGGPNKGLSPFVRNAALDSAALYHANWVVASGCAKCHVETKSLPGITAIPEFWDRAAKYGVTADAENLIRYVGYTKVDNSIDIKSSANTAFLMWKKSVGHLTNMLTLYPKELEARIGIASVPNGEEGFCIVMLVGSN